MGLIDQKSRIMDTILTRQGRSQMAQGKLRAEYISFSDAGAIYQLDTIISGGSDVSDRLTFEAGSYPQDQVTLEADDSGKLFGVFPGQASELVIMRQGQILTGSTRAEQLPVTGSQFNSMAGTLLSSSINNFRKLRLLSSPDPIDDRYDQFLIGPNTAPFTISPDRLPTPSSIQTISVDQAESLFQDKKLSHLPNFKFLPPVNRARIGSSTKQSLGLYVDINQSPILNFQELQSELDWSDSHGYKQTIFFTETSRANNIFAQFFELSNGSLVKLDVIDFGLFPGGTDGSASRHVFFAGKVFTDSKGTTTFVNLFTLVWT
jgi:hypothetical protein